MWQSEYPPIEGTVGVFVGIYGDAWVDNAIHSVERQDAGPVDAVMAVNGPWPNALEKLRAWQSQTEHRVTVVANQSNLGPLGSILLNWDLMSGDWLAIMSQDDLYRPNHLSTMAREGRDAPDDVLAIFTALDGISADGLSPRPGPPFLNAHLDLAPSRKLETEIIRRHPLPAPTVAFRRAKAGVPGLAWYDSGSPDSEWYGLLACRGRFRVLQQVTASYRESPDSESRATGWASRAWQWAQGLNRLLLSAEFRTLAAATPEEEREGFAQDLLAAISARYPGSPLFQFLQFTAAQQLADVWHYPPAEATRYLQGAMASMGESGATRNLASLTAQGAPTVPVDYAALLGQPPRSSALEHAGRRAYGRFAGVLPVGVRQRLYATYDRLRPDRGAR